MEYMDMPDLRSIDVLLGEARILSERCREGISDQQMSEAFEQALSIMIELRVPRMPETDEEWSGILKEAMNGPTASSEEVFAELTARSAFFSKALKSYREAVKNHEWMRAVSMLLATGDERLVTWNDQVVVLSDDGTSCTATVTGPDGSRDAHRMSATSEEGAALAMLLDLHRIDCGIWKR